jgi:hypothetical protein
VERAASRGKVELRVAEMTRRKPEKTTEKEEQAFKQAGQDHSRTSSSLREEGERSISPSERISKSPIGTPRDIIREAGK